VGLKVRSNELAWFEPGRLRAIERQQSNDRLLGKAVIWIVVGGALGYLAVSLSAAPIGDRDQLLIIAGCAVSALLVMLWPHFFGRNVALRKDGIYATVLFGWRPYRDAPRFVAYSDISRCEVTSAPYDGSRIPVLAVYSALQKVHEIELPDESAIEPIVNFLSNRKVPTRIA
jgi:hypothetical protein